MMDLTKMTTDDLNSAIQDCLDTVPSIAGMELSGMSVLKSSQQYQDEALAYQREIDRRRRPERREKKMRMLDKRTTRGGEIAILTEEGPGRYFVRYWRKGIEHETVRVNKAWARRFFRAIIRQGGLFY